MRARLGIIFFTTFGVLAAVTVCMYLLAFLASANQGPLMVFYSIGSIAGLVGLLCGALGFVFYQTPWERAQGTSKDPLTNLPVPRTVRAVDATRNANPVTTPLRVVTPASGSAATTERAIK